MQNKIINTNQNIDLASRGEMMDTTLEMEQLISRQVSLLLTVAARHTHFHSEPKKIKSSPTYTQEITNNGFAVGVRVGRWNVCCSSAH